MNADFMLTITADLRRDEGVRLKIYRDTVGKQTIGVGRNLDDLGLSDDEVDYLLANDIKRCTAELDTALPWWRDMPEPRQRGLLNMAFNLGTPTLLTFRKMLTALRLGDGETAARHALDSKWARQVGARSSRIAALFRQPPSP